MENNDIRWKAIDESIKSAFLHILDTKPYDEISITEICNLCNISRGTFYRHFENTSFLLESFFQQLTEKAFFSPGALYTQEHERKVPLCCYIRSDHAMQCLVRDIKVRELLIKYLLNKTTYKNQLDCHMNLIGCDSAFILYKHFLSSCLNTISENLSLSDEKWEQVKLHIDKAVLSVLVQD